MLVSHDRAFLDNVVTDLYVLDGTGEVKTYVGGYQDYLDAKTAAAKAAAKAAAAQKNAPQPGFKPGKERKFLNRERRELDALPGEIETVEAECAKIANLLADPKTYQDKAAEVPAMRRKLADLEADMNKKFARWEELDALRRELEG